MSSYVTIPDLVVQVILFADPKNRSVKPLVSAERRITPSWTISQLKAKLEPVVGVPASSQILRTSTADGSWITIDDENGHVGDKKWGISKGGEVEVVDTRPPAARQNFMDVSLVEKYEMPTNQYEQLSDSVLAWKKRQKLGRFDPGTKSVVELAEERESKDKEEIVIKKITVGNRCRVGKDDGRRGKVNFVGQIQGLGGEKERGCFWVGVQLDEPVGRNDGSVAVEEGGKLETKRIFDCGKNFGVFARPEKIEMGDWPPLDDLDIGEDMEEI